MELQCNKTRVCKAEVGLCSVNASRINADSAPESRSLPNKWQTPWWEVSYFLTVYLETSITVPSEPDSNASGGQREVLHLDTPMGITAACPRTPALLPTLGHQELGYPCCQRVRPEMVKREQLTCYLSCLHSEMEG